MNIKRPSLAPALKNVFGGDDSEEEEKAPQEEPIDADQAAAIDRLAEYVARNGSHFEESESTAALSSPLSRTSPCTQ